MSGITAKNTHQELAKHLLSDVVPIVVDLDKSHGNRVVDARDGREWLDCFSYVASNAIGYNHPGLFDAEFEKKLLRAARSKPANSDFYTQEMAEFVDTFVRLAVPKSFVHLFFIEGGALAVENALKTAFDWKVRRNKANGLSGELGSRVIHFKQAFHGRSGYTLSLTNTADLRKTKFFPKFDWPRIVNPKLRFPITEQVIAEVTAVEQQAQSEIVSAFEQYQDDIAAIIIEPIQGEGGDNHFRPEFHQLLRSLADTHGALLIYDEVQSGLGLTGKMWAHQHYGMEPDIVCFGKKTQVCGIMAGPRIAEVEHHVFEEASRLNSTWGGGLVDMVRCQRFLEIIEQESLVANADSTGSYLLQGLSSLQGQFPDLLSNARGKGLMCAFDLPSTELRDQLFREVFKRNVLILKAGLNTIRLRPSLTFSQADVDELISVLTDAVAELSKK